MSEKGYPKPRPFLPKNKDKYVGPLLEITARSSWERAMFEYCDRHPAIKRWGSEIVVVPYISPIDGRPHRYFVDLFIELENGEKVLVEIKPKEQTKPPKKPKRKTKKAMENYYERVMTWEVNKAKWEAARDYARRNGMKFVVMTEDDLRNLGLKIG